MGMTVADWWGVRRQEPNCTVMTEVDADSYYDLLVERLGQ